MQISTQYFCSLAMSVDWQQWLKLADENLYNDLMGDVRSGSCRSRKEKMMYIYHRLHERGHRSSFEDFIRRRFPHIIVDSADLVAPNIPGTIQTPVQRTEPPLVSKDTTTHADLNMHGVFQSYRPDILTFPQKKIIVDGSPKRLEERIKSFVIEKFGVDYVIVDDHAYIEYFDYKFKHAVDKMPFEKREIYQYRQRIKHDQTHNNIK